MRNALLPMTTIAVLATGTAHAEEIDRQVAADPKGVVEISNVSGRIDVTGWDRPEVSVRAHAGGGVERVDVTSDHGRTIIKVVYPNFSYHSGSVDLRVQIPRGSGLDITGTSSDITSKDVQGVQRLKTVSGSIRADIAQSDIDVKTISGDIALHGHGQPAQLHLSSVSGDLNLDHGAGDLEATTVSGNLNVSLDTARSVRVRTTSGNFNFEGKLARGVSFDAESISGELKVRARAEAGFEYEANTFSGDIDNCFGVEAERTSRYAPGHRLTGRRGDGSGHVRLKTMSADIELCDRS